MTTYSPLTHTAQMFKVMGNPQRLQILYYLLENGHSLQELAQYTGQNPTQISTHLDKMRQLGIIDATRFMRIVEYRLISPQIRHVLHTMQQEKMQ